MGTLNCCFYFIIILFVRSLHLFFTLFSGQSKFLHVFNIFGFFKRFIISVRKYSENEVNESFQQQLASILDLTIWHLTQTISVSLQESVQRGIREQSPPPRKNRVTHQMMATQPTFFRGIFPVSLVQEAQGDPLPLSPPPPTEMTVGPAAGAGGG